MKRLTVLVLVAGCSALLWSTFKPGPQQSSIVGLNLADGAAPTAETRQAEGQTGTERPDAALRDDRTRLARVPVTSTGSGSPFRRSEIRVYAVPATVARTRPSTAEWSQLIPHEVGDSVFRVVVEDGFLALAVGRRIAPLPIGPGHFKVPLDELEETPPTLLELTTNGAASSDPFHLRVEGFFDSPSDPSVRLPWTWVEKGIGTQFAIPTVPGKILITASRGAESGAWQGTLPVADGTIKVALGGTRSAYGKVENYPGALASGTVVTVRVDESEIWQCLDKAAVAIDGSWAMEALPYLPGAKFIFRVVSPLAVPTQAVVVFPAGTQRVEVPLNWEQGRLQRVKVTDHTGTPVPFANVSMQWSLEGAWNRMHATTNVSGLAEFLSCPETTAYFRVVGSAHSNETQGPWHVPTHSDQTIPLEALLSTSIDGRLFPVELASDGFRIAYWTTDGEPKAQSFGPEARGTFRLENLRRETVYIAATCPSGAGTVRPVELDLELTPPPTTRLQLVPGLRVAGRVVDHLSGQGITGATVQPRWVSNQGQVIEDLPAVAVTGPGGYYQDVPVPPGAITLLVGAEGMAYTNLDYQGDFFEGDLLPTVRLKPLGHLQFRLLGHVDSYESYRFLGESIAGTETRRFGADGTVGFPACPPQEYAHASIETPEGSLMQLFLAMPTAKSWDIPIVVDAGTTIRADYTSVVEAGFDGPFQIRSKYLSGDGVQVTHTRHANSPDHVHVLHDLPPVHCTLTLFSGTEQVALKSADLSAPANQTVRLVPMSERGVIRLLTDPPGLLTTAVVHIGSYELPGHAVVVPKEAKGTLDLGNVEVGPALLTVRSDSHPMSLFTAPCQVVENPDSIVEIEVLHDATVNIQTVSLDGLPLSLPVLFAPANAPFSVLEVAGTMERDKQTVLASPGQYDWKLHAPEYWPTAGRLDADSGPNSVVVIARQRGTVAIESSPLTQLTIWSETDGHATTAWAEDVPATSLSHTNVAGSLQLVLPEGAYRVWPAGQEQSGSTAFTIAPGATTTVTITP